MKIGMCAPVERAATVASLGFDYLEPTVVSITALDEASFSSLRQKARRAPIRYEAFNTLFPRSLMIVGPDADTERTAAYLEKALARVAALGADILVVGSGPSRKVPEGWDVARGMQQFEDALRRVGDEAARHGITAVIEPLNRGETNIVHTVAEGILLAERVTHPNVELLADFYHMRLASEDMGNIVRAGALLRHAHIANSDGRRFPRLRDEDRYDEFFAALAAIGYRGMLSVEPAVGDLEREAPQSLELLRRLASDHGL